MNREERESIVITQPETGVTYSIVVESGSNIILEGDFAESTATRQGVDLEFSFSQGGTVTLVNFFTVQPDSSVILQQPDGAQVSAMEALKAMTMDFQTGP